MKHDRTEREYFDTTLPEHHLVALAAHGIPLSALVDNEQRHAVYETICNRELRVVFPVFWTHKDVVEFYSLYHGSLSADDVFWYVRELLNVLPGRKRLHWIERVNLFHAFGLLRLLDDPGTAAQIIRQHGYRDGVRGATIRNLTDMSAHNVLAMLRYTDPIECIEILDSLRNDPGVVPYFASYQIYYYGGITDCLDVLSAYLETSKRVLIPQSVGALLWLAESRADPQSLYMKERLRDEICPRLEKRIVEEIDRLVRGKGTIDP